MDENRGRMDDHRVRVDGRGNLLVFLSIQMFYILLYPPDSIRWILWITHEYAATAAAVCRNFLVTSLEARVL